MTYLLAKYALIFLLALISGFLFGRWITRRSFVDVSDSYENLRDAATRSDLAHWNKLWCRLDALPASQEVDLSTVMDRFNGLSYAIGNLPTPNPIDLAPVEGKLDVLSKTVSAIPAPIPAKDVDLAPIDERLSAIELELARLGRRLEVVPQETPAPDAVESSGPVILSAASHGEKDNLQRVYGVGPMLESLLNNHGVFYFWQIAGWTDNDVDVMDERLDTFKGRIVRDNWVGQAKQLSREPGAAEQPTEMRISA